MIDHIGLRCSDLEASIRFYRTLLEPLGIELEHAGPKYWEWDDFSIGRPDPEHPVTRGLHIGFRAPSRAHVDAVWQACVDAGFRSDGEPGERPQYTPDYYGAFLLDPDGNSAEAVHRDGMRPEHNVDHFWVRVRDLEASRRFYETVAPTVGLEVGGREHPDRFHVRDPRGGSFALVAGEPTGPVHFAFPAPDDATVHRFWEAATAAGYRDNGGPGERPEYHPGYYGAFVLDPDGHNVEAVHHNR